MGFGILAFLKSLAPFSLYITGMVFSLLAFSGRPRWALLLVTFLLPLRNVTDRLQDFPMGNQFIDILIGSIMTGWFISNFGARTKLFEKSSLNIAMVLLPIYTFISLQWGNHYIGNHAFLDISDPRVQDWKNFCLLPVLYFLTLNNIKDQKWVWRVFVVMCLAMVIMDYYTTSQIKWFSSLESRAKINGTFQFLGPNEVAAFYNQYTIILLSMYFFMKRSFNKTLLFLLIAVNLYCMIFMYSRAAYGALAVGMFLLFTIKNKKLLVPLILAAIFWQVALPHKAVERIQSTTNRYGE